MNTPQNDEVVELFCHSQFWGWRMAECGCPGIAYQAFVLAEAARPIGGHVAPGLELLRHFHGEPDGDVTWAPPPSERRATMLVRPQLPEAVEDETCREQITMDPVVLTRHCQDIIERFDASPHKENATDSPHVMVMSTGRCGTVSLWHLFNKSNLSPHHSYWWQVHWTTLWWMLAGLSKGDGWKVPASQWAQTRAAEWLGAKPMLGCSHLDTIFAPVFAAIHPSARFVYLKRDPESIFRSFYAKNQWSYMQIAPIAYRLSQDGFQYRQSDLEVVENIAWFIAFTDTFVRAFGSLMGGRFIEISSDKLFAQDKSEIAKLLEFTGSDIPLEKATEHFATKINEKASKVAHDSDEAIEQFRQAYAGYRQ
jgi:hypothetical protein